jgi:hypothetical protein
MIMNTPNQYQKGLSFEYIVSDIIHGSIQQESDFKRYESTFKESPEFLESFKKVFADIQGFIRDLNATQYHIDSSEWKEIVFALQHMIRLHIDQKPRSGGIPYVAHPLKVASDVLKLGLSKDYIIAALFHDSLEDQSKKLWTYWFPQSHLDDTENWITWIQSMFGKKVARIVNKLSNPSFDGLSDEALLALYGEHVKSIIEDEEAFPIKFFDLTENALNIAPLKTTNPEKYQWFQKKYKPVIINLQRVFTTMQSSHPLYPLKDATLVKIEEVLLADYNE